MATVRINEDLAAEIDKITLSPAGEQMGFRSRADFVTEAVRDFIRSDMTPVYIPGDLMKLVDRTVQTRKRWVSGQNFIIECINLRLKELEVTK